MVAEAAQKKISGEVATEIELTRIPPRLAPIAQLVEQMTLNH